VESIILNSTQDIKMFRYNTPIVDPIVDINKPLNNLVQDIKKISNDFPIQDNNNIWYNLPNVDKQNNSTKNRNNDLYNISTPISKNSLYNGINQTHITNKSLYIQTQISDNCLYNQTQTSDNCSYNQTQNTDKPLYNPAEDVNILYCFPTENIQKPLYNSNLTQNINKDLNNLSTESIIDTTYSIPNEDIKKEIIGDISSNSKYKKRYIYSPTQNIRRDIYNPTQNIKRDIYNPIQNIKKEEYSPTQNIKREIYSSNKVNNFKEDIPIEMSMTLGTESSSYQDIQSSTENKKNYDKNSFPVSSLKQKKGIKKEIKREEKKGEKKEILNNKNVKIDKDTGIVMRSYINEFYGTKPFKCDYCGFTFKRKHNKFDIQGFILV